MNQRGWAFATLLIRSSLPHDAMTKSVQAEIWKLNPEQPITNVAPVRELVRTSLTQPTLYLTLFSLFAVLALLLAVLGLYGLIAYSVAQRTREFGIRIALGAQAADVLRLVVHQGVRFTGAGLVAGLLAAVGGGAPDGSVALQDEGLRSIRLQHGRARARPDRRRGGCGAGTARDKSRPSVRTSLRIMNPPNEPPHHDRP